MNAPYPQQPPPQKSGFPTWLIILLSVGLFVIALIGILAVLAISGVRKYISASKTAEAQVTVRTLAMDADTAFAADGKLCDSASAPVPTTMAAVSAKKYLSSPSDWSADAAKNAGFACLKFEKSEPQYYQYDYKKSGPSEFAAVAHGDLDGNGVTSEFKLTGQVVGTTVNIAPTVMETNPQE